MGERIRVGGAREHNLKDVSVEMPSNSLVVVTGVSGSGKSSLAFDTIYREGQRRYLGSLSSHARKYIGKMARPDVDRVSGLSPAVAVDQRTLNRSPRSTVGTMSEVYDHLRLLYARFCEGAPLSSSIFSFNTPDGACPACNGLGVEDRINPKHLVDDPAKTIREGALLITTPTGYLVYSQVTLDVLDQVCRAHGFNVDIPWRDLNEEQLKVVLQGSDKIKVPYGKHPLESRLKWSGIAAKPREEGYYKGIVPVMEQILKRDRNKNILRFTDTVTCSQCKGGRLKVESLYHRLLGYSIVEISRLTVAKLRTLLSQQADTLPIAAGPVLEGISTRCELLEELGLGYLEISRASASLSGGEAQRIRLVNQVVSGLQGMMYVLDEPSVGLHPRDSGRMMNLLRRLQRNGNSVIVVEHDEVTMQAADWIVDVGPGAGVEGGEVLFSGPVEELCSKGLAGRSVTARHLAGNVQTVIPSKKVPTEFVEITNARHNNLRVESARFALGGLNVVTGVSGAGKSSLVFQTFARAVSRKLGAFGKAPGIHGDLKGAEVFDKIIEIDQSPIGRTPRSNPATYTKLFDGIRGLFAARPLAKERGFNKGRFSFNVKGGRCEVCEGAGVRQVGMHFLEDVSVTCERCAGRRFDEGTLEVKYKELDIHQVLEMSVEEAVGFFEDQPKISRMVKALDKVGLGYVALGQPSTSLSGGEAQRVKLAAQLGRSSTGRTLYLLDEPTTGLHGEDVRVLLGALLELVDAGNTVVVIEHHPGFVRSADWIVDMGPESGDEGGRVVVQGTLDRLESSAESITGSCLRGEFAAPGENNEGAGSLDRMILKGVSTNNLKDLDVEIPHDSLVVITGVSGSGKSSLAYDTINAEGKRRFAESLSTQARRHFKQMARPAAGACLGMRASIGVDQERWSENPRSTVGTLTEVFDLYRLLFARAGEYAEGSEELNAGMFSFNRHEGSCPKCKGLGMVIVCDPRKLVTHPEKSLLEGAMDGTKTGSNYGEEKGRYPAILAAAGKAMGMDFSLPWSELDQEAKQVAMYGLLEKDLEVVWNYDRKGRKGEHSWTTKWEGFATYVEEEYQRTHGDRRGEDVRKVMSERPCPGCEGARLKPTSLKVLVHEKNIAELCAMSVDAERHFLKSILHEGGGLDEKRRAAALNICAEAKKRLDRLSMLGLGYLSLDRRTDTLSGGELQRVRLASYLETGLKGVTYVFDEPTVGLHRRDTARLMDALERLRDGGNTVIVVEHDRAVMERADMIVDMGPGGGEKGGEILAVGTFDQVVGNPRSVTGRYLGERKLPKRKPVQEASRGEVRIRGAHVNNLLDVDVEIPLGRMTAVTGVSGSGKTSLVFDVVAPSVTEKRAVGCEEVEGFEDLEWVRSVDQRPIGRTPASTPATYCGVLDHLRDYFGASVAAKAAGLKKASFSHNSKQGHCEACQGIGRTRLEMGFLADAWVSCDACEGKRYAQKVLDVRVEGRNIADVLEMTVHEAMAAFHGEKRIRGALEALVQVGLGYMTLGQGASTMSGGEAQRLKLARDLAQWMGRGKRVSTNGLYIFDEPTTGLHPADVEGLIEVLSGLVDKGCTVLLVEHDPDVIAAADHVVDLGPEGGADGGRVVVAGDPTVVSLCKESHTGKVLKGRIG